jgi:hypothetical protein
MSIRANVDSKALGMSRIYDRLVSFGNELLALKQDLP